MKYRFLWFLVLAFVFGCVAPEQESQIALLNDRLDTLERKVESLSLRVSRLEKQVNLSSAKEAESIYNYVKNLESEIYNLRGDLDSTNQNCLALQRRVEDLEFQIVSLGKKVASLGVTEESQQNATSTEAPKVSTPEALYAEALALFKKGDFEKAKAKFEKFLSKYPDHRLASNAFYWIGEAYYGMGKYKEAILQFEDLRRKYPDSSKIPASMLKEAKAFLMLKDKAGARIILKQLIRMYPKSREASLARDLLKKIR